MARLTKTLYIDGMTCANCENRIERKLKTTKGISKAVVSYVNGTAQVTFDSDTIKLDKIEGIVEGLDYKVVNARQGINTKSIINAAGVGIIILAVYMLLNHFGFLNFFNMFPQAEAGMGYGMLFIIGLLTSVHCIAMCGGINLSQCISPATSGNPDDGKLANLRSSFLYNFGRVISYTLIGGIVGGIGNLVGFSGSAKGIVQLAAGVFMVIMGLNMLGLFPFLRKLSLRTPKLFTNKLSPNKKSGNSPLYVGLLNGLMPCGPLQAMQLYALSTCSVTKGAFSMLLFCLGTVPLMFGLGALSSILSKKFTSKMMTVGAVLVILLGMSMFSAGMSLSGAAIAVSQPDSGNMVEIVDGVQNVTTQLYPNRYESITVKVGVPVRWNITADPRSINGCNNAIIIPEYDIVKGFEVGDNIIEFTPTETGVFPYSCWMGMMRSSITVVE